jgi:hygromycin-B 4-O-kinase
MERNIDEVAAALAAVDFAPTDVEAVGAGAWSTCFGFVDGARDLVVRFGRHVGDFEKDAFAHRWSTSTLPVPRVLAIERYGDEWLSVSERCPGTPLEGVESDQWSALIPAVANLLSGLRDAGIPSAASGGWGGWDGSGVAPDPSWLAHLSAWHGADDTRRTADWYESLGQGRDAFDAGRQRLLALDVAGVPRALIHADLINRNVHVVDDRITGVFDWGCGRYGDPWYDLAWFEFWAPFHPNLDVGRLLDEMRRRTSDVPGDRRIACLAHIGLDHIVYNATRGADEDLVAVITRMSHLSLL